ncbi:MAG TPA: nicotinate phosphoribosyltransferase [Longimicrobiaceae bacterium]|jgi:nicotinate phosphoribosyltransferase
MPTSGLYGTSLALLTDLYQATMAYGYWKHGRRDEEAVFNLFFRRTPFGGGYAVAAGLAPAIDFLRDFRFAPDDLDYLGGLAGADGAPLFEPGFLRYLGEMELACDIDAVPEGTPVFAHEPLVRVKGPIIQAQLLETALLNIVNANTLFATKAARIVQAAQGAPVVEFGLRRAQGIDGGLTASRAAFIGGCVATSNVLAGKLFGIPVRGTHAHSWVMSFDGELEAFEAYAAAMPNNCVFLVDTYDTLEGTRNAVRVGRALRERGHELLGIRLDSGDLAYLSIEARKILDQGGFPDAKIFASNDLDERTIEALRGQGARIDVWGVGTKLSTAYDQPALGGVYKLSAVRRPGGEWQDRLKLSENPVKRSIPGLLGVRRFRRGGEYVGDVIYDERFAPEGAVRYVHPTDALRRNTLGPGVEWEELLVPVFRGGRQVYTAPSPAEAQARLREQLARFHPGVRRFDNPHEYPAGIEEGLSERRNRMILALREAPAVGGRAAAETGAAREA